MKVVYINREPRKTGFSIEGIFNLIKASLKGRIEIGDYNLDPTHSRLANILRIRKYAGDINHVTGDVHFLLIGLPGRKNLLTIHDLVHYEKIRSQKLKHALYHYFWFYFPLRNATYVTAISQFTKDHLLSNFDYPAERIKIVYDPVKPIFEYVPKVNINPIPRILQIGSAQHKNLPNLIEAVRGLNVHLDIVAFVAEAIINRLREYGISYTIYNGLTDEGINERYVSCDMLFFASFVEGFGMPIIEAQSVGRPVITSNSGAMKEVAEASALLVDPHNVEEIRQAIIELVNNRGRYDELVLAGRQNIKRFHHEKIAQDYLNVYEEMMR